MSPPCSNKHANLNQLIITLLLIVEMKAENPKVNEISLRDLEDLCKELSLFRSIE